MFDMTFEPVLGFGCACLLILLGYRLIEATFFMIGFIIGKARAPKPTVGGLDPVLLKQGVSEIVKQILEERVTNPGGGPLNTKPTGTNPA